ncbi:G-protein-coupled receptor family protein [Cavenderia fasciculata]|uniref:G-protein-coupled receptor family protein n=1 Tax=Cavenderia fasciculata TaxID=261658 RepID=F4PMF0_CACFS|nr:G-protein-coupled receptor family protein [Cavenderia fasciculata]EGG22800.1 G-protein-coupled receptor family protein [Cavenderia fasciculata]|eukprot:XP_004360651.1 G-protein-coupled receptor family protein [Cavenderia fasciculata]
MSCNWLLFFLYIIVFIQSSTFTFAQDYHPVDPTGRCEKYIGDPVDTPLCQGLLANADSVYVNSTASQSDLQTQALQFKLILDFGGSDQCKVQNTYKTLCALFFMECIEYQVPNTSTVLAFPKFPCSANCYNTTELCQIPTNLLDCSSKVIGGGYNFTLFPLESALYNLTSFGGDTNHSVTCQNPNLINSNTTFGLCPFPLVEHPTDDQERSTYEGYIYISNISSCVAPCPSPLFKPQIWTNIFTMGDILSFLSFFATIFLIITYGILNPKITRFDKINLCVMSAACGVALAGVIQAINGTQDSLCPEPGRSASPIDDLCLTTGFILHVSALYVVTWWCIMAFEVWFAIKTVGAKKREFFKYYCIGTSLISWIFPIATISAKEYHAGPGNVFCWIWSSKYRNIFFWGPLGVFLFAGTIFLILLIREIYIIVSIKISKMDQSRWNILKMEVKPIGSLVAYYTILLYLFAYDQYIVSAQHEYFASIPQYFACLTNPKTTDPEQECLVLGPSVAGVGFFVFCIRIFGFFSFLLYGLSSRTKKIWSQSIVFNNKIVKIISAKLDQITNTTALGSSNSSNTPGGPNDSNFESGATGAGMSNAGISVAHEMEMDSYNDN